MTSSRAEGFGLRRLDAALKQEKRQRKSGLKRPHSKRLPAGSPTEAFHPCPMTAIILCKPLESADLRLPVPTRQTGIGRGREEDGPGGAGPSRRGEKVWRADLRLPVPTRRTGVGRGLSRAGKRSGEPEADTFQDHCDRRHRQHDPRRERLRDRGHDLIAVFREVGDQC
jgi:hypothetical protein